MQIIGGEGRESTNLLKIINLPWQVLEKKTFTKIEAHAGMAEQLVRYLAIKEALQKEIKDTLEHNNQSYGEWCAQTEKGKKQNLIYQTLYDSIKEMKLFQNFCITPQPCHSNFYC